MELKLPSKWKAIDEEPYEYANLIAETFGFELPNPSYEKELQREICSTHILWGHKVRAIGYCLDDINEILYETNLPGSPYVVVHLTWAKEKSPKFPNTILYRSFEDFMLRESP